VDGDETFLISVEGDVGVDVGGDARGDEIGAWDVEEVDSRVNGEGEGEGVDKVDSRVNGEEEEEEEGVDERVEEGEGEGGRMNRGAPDPDLAREEGSTSCK